MKKLLSYLIAQSIVMFALAQGLQDPLMKSDVKQWTVGDRLPETKIEKLFQHGKTTPFFLGKQNTPLVIIDFWTTRCPACIKSMPKLDSMRQHFPKELTVLMSTYEDEATVRNFKEKNPIARKVNLPLIVEDHLLGAYFEHISIPHLVWVFKDTVVAITGTEYVRVENIKMVLSGKKPDWPVKREIQNYDYTAPLLKADKDKLFTGSRLKYSAVTGYMDGIPSGMGIQTDTLNHTKRGYIINLPVVNAYFILYMKLLDVTKLIRPGLFLTANQVVVENDRREKYWFDREVSGYRTAWRRENDICLEVMLPDKGQADTVIYRYMLEELNRLLELHGRFETRTVQCWVIKGPGHSANTDLSAASNIQDLLKQTPLTNFVYQLNLLNDVPPVFNESDYEGSIGAEASSDIGNLREALRKYNLQVMQEERKVDQFVISADKSE